MPRKRNLFAGEVVVSRAAAAAVAAAGLAAAGIGALLWRRRRRDETNDGQQLRDRPTGEVNFVDDGVQGY